MYDQLYHPTWDVDDSTKIQCYMTCPRMFFYEYVLGWRPSNSGHDLVFGEAWHRAMECILTVGYTEQGVEAGMVRFMDYYREFYSPDTDDIYYPKSPGMARQMLLDYVRKYASDYIDYELLFTEVAGTVPIKENKVLHFRLDALLKVIRKNKFAVMEHKTTKMTGRMWEDQWLLSIQLGTYSHVLFALFAPEEVDGCIVNGTIFQKTKPGFIRLPIRKSMGQMNTWFDTVLYWMEMKDHDFSLLRQASPDDDLLFAFRQNPTNCTKYRGCPYLEFCVSWPNPLRRCDELPIGFHVERWDPRDREKESKFIFDGQNVLPNSQG